MRTIGLLVAVAIVFALVSSGFFVAGRLDHDMADAQLQTVTGEYAPLSAVLERAQPYYDYASRVPWIGTSGANGVRAKKAALRYWQRACAAIIENATEPFAAVPTENVDLQFLVAGALYRQGVARAKDRNSTVEALDTAIDGYHTVLKNAARHEDAAYNY